MSKEFEQVAPLPDVYRGWRDQLNFYKLLAERMPDQRRSIETPDGWEQGPRAIVDHAIRDAEHAALAGDIDGFALHIQQAVEVFIHADFDEVALPDVRREQNRIDNLPNAEEQYARWREIAAEIRQTKPYIKSTSEIARQVRHRLVNSHDDRDRRFIKSIRAIRDII